MTPREDLRPYVESTRFAITWADVEYAESVGRPYPMMATPKPEVARKDSPTLTAFTRLFGVTL